MRQNREELEKFIQCNNKYGQLRKLSRDLLEEEAMRDIRRRITATGIDADALLAVAGWSGRKVDWDWGSIQRTLRKSHPRRYELALWCERILCGLVVGRLSDSKRWLSLTFIEGNPKQHPLKGEVVPLALQGASLYAGLMADEVWGGPEVRVKNPLPEARHVYVRAGFTLTQSEAKFDFLVEPR